MRTPAVQAANGGVLTADGLRATQGEMTQLTNDIDRIAEGSEFNGQHPYAGPQAGLGERTRRQAQRGPVFGAAFTTTTGSYAKADGVPRTDVNLIIEPKVACYGHVTTSGIGSSWQQVRMGASESRIRDADMAKEMANRAKDQIVAQAGTSMLAQANQAPQAVLKLLPTAAPESDRPQRGANVAGCGR